MTDLLTPDKIQKELNAANDAAARETDPDMQWAFLNIARICRDYLTLWDRNKELEAQIKKADAALDEALDEIYNRPAGQ